MIINQSVTSMAKYIYEISIWLFYGFSIMDYIVKIARIQVIMLLLRYILENSICSSVSLFCDVILNTIWSNLYLLTVGIFLLVGIEVCRFELALMLYCKTPILKVANIIRELWESIIDALVLHYNPIMIKRTRNKNL